MVPSDTANSPVLPDSMPLIVLPECHLFPGCLMPLYIFEERYRQMLAHALSNNRMFCIGNRIDNDGEETISEFSTAGLVRACVQQDDGTSQLLLLGLQRIQFTGWIQEKPFRIASIKAVPTIVEKEVDIVMLKEKALSLFNIGEEGQAKKLRDVLALNDDLDLVCDVLSYHFTRCPKLQQKLLGEPSLTRRYELLITALEKHQCG